MILDWNLLDNACIFADAHGLPCHECHYTITLYARAAKPDHLKPVAASLYHVQIECLLIEEEAWAANGCHVCTSGMIGCHHSRSRVERVSGKRG